MEPGKDQAGSSAEIHILKESMEQEVSYWGEDAMIYIHRI